MRTIRNCTHIKVTGVRCGSPALRGEQYCYFHQRMLCSSRLSPIALLENEEAIQVSIMEIVDRLLCGTIELKRGELVLRALNTAVRNSRRARFENVRGMVRELPPDPIVPPRPRQHSMQEVDAQKQQLLDVYFGRDTSKPEPKAPAAAATNSLGADATLDAVHGKPPAVVNKSAAPHKNLAADAVVRRASPQPVSALAPAQRKPPTGVKKIAAPQGRKAKARRASAW